MPTYEYSAENSSRAALSARGFEHVQRLSDAPLTQCPRCGTPCAMHLAAFHRALAVGTKSSRRSVVAVKSGLERVQLRFICGSAGDRTTQKSDGSAWGSTANCT